MKRTTLLSSTAAMLMLGLTGITVEAADNNYPTCRNHNCAQINLVGGELLLADQQSILYMREEEKLARDVYLFLARTWNSSIHQHIAESEQRHMDMVKRLISLYQLTDSAAIEEGVFHDAQLQSLYNDLIVRGQRNANEALLVGALIEEVDIADLEQALLATINPDLIATYEQLLQASYRHLNLFVRTWNAQTGATYTAQVLPQAAVENIVNSTEQGRGMRRGRRW